MRLHAILFDYYSFRLDFLRKVEGEPVNQSTGGVYAYVDWSVPNVIPRRGVAHIGIGINLQENPGQIPVFSNIRNV